MMFQGRLEAIALRSAKSGAVQLVQSATAQTERGLVGDYVFARLAPEEQNEPDKQITLIEAEALEAVQSEKGYSISHGESRRNLLTRGVPLNHLVGKRFRVGALLLEGQELCEPCKHLEKLTGKLLISHFLHRCGLRARIVEGGSIQIGDVIECD
jgi:MOSC domain-containing protein YiiM